MDSIQHAAQGALIMSLTNTVVMADEQSLAVYAGAVIVGASPDLIGALEKIVKRNWNVWNWYSAAHSAGALFVAGLLFFSGLLVAADTGAWWFPAYTLAYILHLGLDAFTHVDLGAKRNWFPPSWWWKEKFWAAVAYCWPNWLGWTGTVTLYLII